MDLSIIAIIAALIWIAICSVVGTVASGRGHNGTIFFIVSFFFSPLIGLILAFLIPATGPAARRGASIAILEEDARRWENLSRYDAELQSAVQRLSPLGDDAVRKFRDVYLDVQDKPAVPAIISDIEADVRSGRISGATPAGFHRVGARAGVTIHGNGQNFYVHDKFLPSIGAAKAYALSVSKRLK